MRGREESKTIKQVLKRAEFDVLSVGHGRGTGSGWLHIEIAKPLHEACEEHGSIRAYDHKDCFACQRFTKLIHEMDLQATALAQQTSGRHGEYEGRISIRWA